MPTETNYIVLRHVNAGDSASPVTWEAIDWNVSAASAEAAVRKTVSGLNPADGAYVATPMRSWKPVTVRAETQTVLKLEQPT
jgi:hypothetical protein